MIQSWACQKIKKDAGIFEDTYKRHSGVLYGVEKLEKYCFPTLTVINWKLYQTLSLKTHAGVE